MTERSQQAAPTAALGCTARVAEGAGLAGAGCLGSAGGDFAGRLAEVRRRVRCAGGDPSIAIVAVTKGQPVSAVVEAARAGLAGIGESYAQELLAKASELASRGVPVRWHFLGALQRNKLGRLAPVVSCWQGLAHQEEALALARHAPGAVVLVEVDWIGGRQGCDPGEAPRVVESARAAGLVVQGLMTVGPPGDPEGSRRVFLALSALADELSLEERSMGMSEDLEAAVAAGSTMLRLGSALFGPRRERLSGRDAPAAGQVVRD